MACICTLFYVDNVDSFVKQFHAMETYITHFLEEARFPKAPVLAWRKVNFYFMPGSVS